MSDNLTDCSYCGVDLPNDEGCILCRGKDTINESGCGRQAYRIRELEAECKRLEEQLTYMKDNFPALTQYLSQKAVSDG